MTTPRSDRRRQDLSEERPTPEQGSAEEPSPYGPGEYDQDDKNAVAWARYTFLQAVDRLYPKVLDALAGEPLQLYRAGAQRYRGAPPPWEYDGIDHPLYGGDYPEAQPFRASLRAWSERHGLSAEWCIDAAWEALRTKVRGEYYARTLADSYARYPGKYPPEWRNPYAADDERLSWWSPEPLARPWDPTPPPLGGGRWNLGGWFGPTPAGRLQALLQEPFVLQHRPFSPAIESWTEYRKAINDAIGAQFAEYQREIDALMADEGLAKRKGVGTKTPSAKHFEWLAHYQVGEKSYSSIGGGATMTRQNVAARIELLAKFLDLPLRSPG